MGNLDKSIAETSVAIQNLIAINDNKKEIEAANKGVVQSLANGAETICVHLKPFFKTFLSVAGHASAVRPCLHD